MSALYTLVKKCQYAFLIYFLFWLLNTSAVKKRDDPKSIWIPIVISFLSNIYQIISLLFLYSF